MHRQGWPLIECPDGGDAAVLSDFIDLSSHEVNAGEFSSNRKVAVW